MTKPPANDLDYSVRRHYVDRFYLGTAAVLPPGSLVLDLGGVRSGKRGLFNIEDYGLKVIYANLSPDKGADVRADGADLPFATDSFDAVVCSEVLEFVPDPARVVREMFRVLKPGGEALICVPFFFRVNPEPADYGRYTGQYWTETLAAAGFGQVSVEPQGFFFSVLAHLVADWLVHLRRHRLKSAVTKRLAAWAVFRVRQAGPVLDRRGAARPGPYGEWLRSHVTGYGLKAVK